MAKNQFQDIVPPQKRSIRDVPLPPNRRAVGDDLLKQPARPESAKISSKSPILPPPSPPPYHEDDYSAEPKRSRLGLWILALISVAIVFFGVSYLFASAVVTITPKSQELSINQTATASKTTTSNNLSYAVISLEKEGSQQVQTSGTEKVSVKASGQIIIYNNYNATPQSLVANTRFETPEGLIFRIDKEVTVPGETNINGKVTPGNVEATVYADAVGEEYNVGLKDFTVPGFKGTPKYQGFYARSKTPLTGGFVGTRPKITDADLQNAKEKIEANLYQQFLNQANSQKPENFVLFDGAIITNYTLQPNTIGSTSSASVVEKGRAYAIVFSRDIINSYILNQVLHTDSASSSVESVEGLKFILQNKENFNPDQTSDISFNLSGTLKLLSVVNVDSLKNDLSGVSRSDLNDVLGRYPSIEKASVIFKPFWKWSFPDKTAKIKVEITTP